MSETYIEWTGNIQVHHPVKHEAEVIPMPRDFWDHNLARIEAAAA